MGYLLHFRRLSRRENFRCPLSAATFLSTVSVFELKKNTFFFVSVSFLSTMVAYCYRSKTSWKFN